MSFFGRLIAVALSVLLISQSQLAGQQGARPQDSDARVASGQAPAGRTAGLRILVLEGQNSLNSVVTGSAISPLVQVLDSLDRPVVGADVTFEVLPTGPGGTFGDRPIATTKTDYSGQATAAFTANRTPGAFSIKVTASFAGETAQTRVNQVNTDKVTEATVQPPPKPWYAKWQWWALIGAGAAGLTTALVLAGGDHTNTITISPGTPVIGGQR